MREKLIAYSLDYVSFLLGNLNEKEVSSINNIILFGSVARGDFSKTSDIDIFIDVINEKTRIEKSVEKLTKDFFDSVKFKEYWKLLGIDKRIKPMVGKLKDWKDLRESIILNGITLYGKFKEFPEKGRPMILFQWDSIKNNSKRVLLNKRLFGYKQYGKIYKGLTETLGGEKLGSNSMLIPVEHYKKIENVFKDMKIVVSMREVII
jgi:predicted nucleotidyltransferase